MKKTHSCKTCEMRSPKTCGFLCQPPSKENPEGVDLWQPRHYSSFRKWDAGLKMWVFDQKQFVAGWNNTEEQ